MKYNFPIKQITLLALLTGLFSCNSTRQFEAVNTENSSKNTITLITHSQPLAVSEAASGEVSAPQAAPDANAEASAAAVTAEAVATEAPVSDAVGKSPIIAHYTSDFYQPEITKPEAHQLKAQKKGIKHFFSNLKNSFRVDALELILAIFLPPIGVLLHDNGLSTRFWISLILTFLFFIPGMIYAILVVTDTI